SPDGFVARINANLTILRQVTYLGGSFGENIHALAIHPVNGQVLVAGETGSADFPCTTAIGRCGNGAQTTPNGLFDAFVARLNPDLTAVLQATYFGGNQGETIYALTVSPMTGEVLVAGSTGSTNLPCTTAGGGCSDGAQPQRTLVGFQDAFLARLSADLAGPPAPPTINKVFAASTVPLHGATVLSFTINNPNPALGLTGIAFTDTLPPGLVVATPNALTGGCGAGTITATAGSNSVNLTGGTVAASASCTFGVNVTGITGGVKSNTTAAITATEAGVGATSNTVTITVVTPLTIAKAFGAAAIPLNGSTSLTIVIQNPNATVALTGVAFTDTLPAGLEVATPNAMTNSCGGTATATAGSGAVSLANGAIVAGGSCAVSSSVTGVTAGDKNNTTGSVASTNGGSGTSASATTTVVAPPTIAKSFMPATIVNGASSTLTFTLANPAANTVALTGVGLIDILPFALSVPGASVPVCGGTLTTTAADSIVLSGATIAVGNTCQFNVTVTGTAPGNFTNTTGLVNSANGGNGGTASATLTVLQVPIPTLDGWMLALLVGLLLLASPGQLRVLAT
nr:hypothetical protein [Burkholderiales bacterium]